jgi:hypothetical protein
MVVPNAEANPLISSACGLRAMQVVCNVSRSSWSLYFRLYSAGLRP